jgi:hypothetical protein
MQIILISIVQTLAVILIGLVTGSMFAIWQGYPITDYSPATFVEVHQGAVRGLNTLLPVAATASLALVALLATFARHRPGVMWLYLGVAAMIALGGLVTRLINQPINALVMTWTATTLPTDWIDLRDRWWTWHQIRLFFTFVGEAILIATVLIDRKT